MKVASKLHSTRPGPAAFTGAQKSPDPLQFQPFQDVNIGAEGEGRGLQRVGGVA